MKVSKAIKEKAIEVARANGLRELWVNDKGEFFSNENFASLSVEGNRDRYAEIHLSPNPSPQWRGADSDLSTQGATSGGEE
jgi:hypothetical protein